MNSHIITRGLAAAALGLCLLAAPALAQDATLKADDPAFATAALTWRGQHRWAWTSDDGEAGTLALDTVAQPGGSYLMNGIFLLDDAELGVTGAGRWRAGKLIIDLVVVGGIRDQVPDAGKRRLYAKGRVPAKVDAAGFAAFRAELDGATLAGISQQYQVNVVTGDKVQGPVYRNGRLTPAR